jgi:hypothetical protein
MKMANLVKLAGTAMLALSLGCLGGCSSEERCSYNHQSYPKGTSFPDKDGCNTCTCVASGAVECTLMACLTDAGFLPPPDVAPDARDAAVGATPDAGFLPPPDVAPDARDAAVDATPDAGFLPPLDVAPDARDAAVDAAPDVPLPIDTVAPDGGAAADYCVLPTGLTFYVQRTIQVPGGIASYTETYHLDNNGLVITRYWWNGYDAEYLRTCTPVLPACGLTDQITVWNVGAGLADPAVKAALASPPYTTFGAVKWPADALSITSDSGGPIQVGLPCGDPDAGPCQPIPPALQRLRDDLQALAAAGVAQPACVELLKQ